MDRAKLFVFLAVAAAIITHEKDSWSADSCGIPLRSVNYVAKFYVKHRPTPVPLRIEIGRERKPGPTDWVARVVRVQPGTPVCESICRARSIIGSHSITQFSCESAGLQVPLAPMTLFRDEANPLVRFGTWIDGYRDFQLKVERDTIQPVIAAR